MQIQDLPRDINSQLSTLRAPLTRLVNSARHSESKRKLLRETLETALSHLAPTEEKAVEQAVEAPVPKKAARKRATAKVKQDE